MMRALPVADLHCDLLLYLATVPGADVMRTQDIGVSVPHLKAGHVALQVLAIFAPAGPGSTLLAGRQVHEFEALSRHSSYFRSVSGKADLMPDDRIAILPAMENASCFCEEDEALEEGFSRLSRMIDRIGPFAYISFTHHGENRFGGGNKCARTGLKADGKSFLEWLDGKNIPVDLSHASDLLVEDIFSYISRQRLRVSVLASHSNFRGVCDHVRNLPDEFALELIQQGGIIGINFLKTYVHPDDPTYLTRHLSHGWNLSGGCDAMALGADFFSPIDFPWPERLPLFFPEHEHAGKYQQLLKEWTSAIPALEPEKLAYKNVEEYFGKTLFPRQI